MFLSVNLLCLYATSGKCVGPEGCHETLPDKRLRLQFLIHGYSMRHQDKLELISPVRHRETHLAMEWLGCQQRVPVGFLDKCNLIKGAGVNSNSNPVAGC